MLRTSMVVLLVALSALPAQAASGDLDGLVVDRDGRPLAEVVVTLGDRTDVTGPDGRFSIRGVGPGTVTVDRVAYVQRRFSWSGTSPVHVTMAPLVVRGLHVAGWVSSEADRFQDMLDIGATTSVNALVVDIKDESGRVYHRSEVPAVSSLGATYDEPFDLAGRTAIAHAQGFYVIVRIVAFQDPVAARARPEWAAIDLADGEPLTRNGQYFLDPTDSGARGYALDLAEEACRAGVDEVQFDYVRFPDGGTETVAFDGPSDEPGRIEAITSFLTEAHRRLLPQGCATAADIFGWITNTRTDGGIGQHLESIIDSVDVVSPMVYPSHYSSGWYGFDVPNDHPAVVVSNASKDALARMTRSTTVLRPWLQDFWYTAGQVEAQVRAVDDLDLGWMLWNVRSEFTVSGIPAAGTLDADTATPAVVEGLPDSGFFDVPDGSTFSADVAWIKQAAITSGCNPPWTDLFCPFEPVSRGQMAAFLVRALGLAPVAGDPFWDDDGSVFESDIESLAAAGITRGCNPPHNTRFCPDEPVTRGQMAAFLARAFG